MTKEELKALTFKLVCDLATEIDQGSRRMDVRERITAVAMILRHGEDLWGSDDADRGSAVRKYESAFQKAASGPSGAEDTGPATGDDDGEGVGDAGNGADPDSCVPRNAD